MVGVVKHPTIAALNKINAIKYFYNCNSFIIIRFLLCNSYNTRLVILRAQI